MKKKLKTWDGNFIYSFISSPFQSVNTHEVNSTPHLLTHHQQRFIVFHLFCEDVIDTFSITVLKIIKTAATSCLPWVNLRMRHSVTFPAVARQRQVMCLPLYMEAHPPWQAPGSSERKSHIWLKRAQSTVTRSLWHIRQSMWFSPLKPCVFVPKAFC